MTYMEGRGVRNAHLTLDLHDGRRVCAGTTLEGWWVSVYRDGHSTARGLGETLVHALAAAGSPGGVELVGELVERQNLRFLAALHDMVSGRSGVTIGALSGDA